MYKVIQGNRNYKISLTGEIVTTDNSECTLIVKDGKISIDLYGVTKTVDVKWLALISHYEIELPYKFADRINNVVFLDVNVICKKSFIDNKVPIFKKPIYVKPLFRIIPGYSRYAINEHGVINEISTGEYLFAKLHKGSEYPTISIYSPLFKRRVDVYIHRLVALTWVPNDNFIERCIVNHKNGDKNLYHKDNLEWVSYSENAIHAFKNNLRNDNKPCKIRNFYTKQVKIFNTFTEACLYMGFNRHTNLDSINYKRKSKLIKNTYELKLLSDESPWFYEGIETLVKQGRYTVTVTMPDKTIKMFYDTRDIIKELKIYNVGSGINSLIDKANKLYPGIIFDIVDNYNLRTLQVLNVATNEIKDCDSVRSIMSETLLSRGQVKKCLKYGENYLVGNYAVRYKIDRDWNRNFTDVPYGSMCIEAINVSTDECLSFKSLRDTAKYFKIDRSVIVLRLKNGKDYNGWKFKEIKN